MNKNVFKEKERNVQNRAWLHKSKSLCTYCTEMDFMTLIKTSSDRVNCLYDSKSKPIKHLFLHLPPVVQFLPMSSDWLINSLFGAVLALTKVRKFF